MNDKTEAWGFEEYEEFGDSSFFRPGWVKRVSLYEPPTSETIRNVTRLIPERPAVNAYKENSDD